ncbi:MAG: hypothetical protein OHK0038_17890 [Flammeovirgaceae bacterium]
MSVTKTHLTTQHQEHAEWVKSLDFYREEIEIIKKRLSEVSSKNTSKEVKMLVNHFENQCIINAEVIDELKHEIGVYEKELVRIIEQNAVAIEHKLVKDHSELRGKMQVFEKLFGQLRKDFNKFLGEVM